METARLLKDLRQMPTLATIIRSLRLSTINVVNNLIFHFHNYKFHIQVSHSVAISLLLSFITYGQSGIKVREGHYS